MHVSNNPHASKLSKEEKEEEILTNAILTVDKLGIHTANEFFAYKDTMIYLVSLFDIRNADKKVIEVEKMDENGNRFKANVTKKTVMKLMVKYIKRKIPSEDAFWLEDLLLSYAEEIVKLHEEAVADLPAYYAEHPEEYAEIKKLEEEHKND